MGVILQGGLKIDPHMTETANMVKRLFHALARLERQGWGYQAAKYIVLCKVLFQSIGTLRRTRGYEHYARGNPGGGEVLGFSKKKK